MCVAKLSPISWFGKDTKGQDKLEMLDVENTWEMTWILSLKIIPLSPGKWPSPLKWLRSVTISFKR